MKLLIGHVNEHYATRLWWYRGSRRYVFSIGLYWFWLEVLRSNDETPPPPK